MTFVPLATRVAFIASLTAVLALGCKKPEGKAELTSAKQDGPPIAVQTAAAVERAMPEHLVLTGTLRASQESEVAADAAGKVTATFVERGQAVKKGTTLAILDSRGAAITASAMNAQSNLAQAQLEQAKRECERVKSLKDSGAISQAEYDRVTSQCQTTQFQVAAAQAQAQNAAKMVGDAVIRAPFDGIIGERYVNVGQYVQPSTKIVSLYTPDPLRLELTVPEQNIGGLKVDLPITFTVTAHGDQKFDASLKFIAPNVRPTTRDLVVEAFAPNPEAKLRPGMFALARLQVGEKKMTAIPADAVKKGEGGDARVYVVVDKTIQERVVQVASEADGHVGIAVGVKPGDNVVVKPGADVRDGAKVK
jgi:membrane fusion protein, multidrug efflux system